MNYYIFIRPVIGAGIGYITNWIAVKMLFRPLKPVKIGKLNLPFTPGIIPKNQERLAIAIGDSISNNLLTEESLRETLLSDDKKAQIRQNIENSLKRYIEENPDTSAKDFLLSVLPEDKLIILRAKLTSKLTSSILASIKEANLAEMISEQVQLSAISKLQGSLLGVFGGNALISSLGPEITANINSYLDENGEEVVTTMIKKEFDKAENSKISVLLEKSNEEIVSFIMDLYEKIIIEKLPRLLETVNISKVVSDKIISMPTLELEKLILEIMKKELNALVNLGALIGFILGLLNLLF